MNTSQPISKKASIIVIGSVICLVVIAAIIILLPGYLEDAREQDEKRKEWEALKAEVQKAYDKDRENEIYQRHAENEIMKNLFSKKDHARDSTQRSQEPTGDSILGERVTELTGGFSYCPPHSWTVTEAPAFLKEQYGIKYRIALGSPKNGFAPNLVITSESFDGSLDTYSEHASQLAAMMPGFRKISKSDIQANKAVQIKKFTAYSNPDGRRELYQTWYYLTGSGSMKFVLTFSTTSDDVDREGAFDASAKSFTLLEPKVSDIEASKSITEPLALHERLVGKPTATELERTRYPFPTRLKDGLEKRLVGVWSDNGPPPVCMVFDGTKLASPSPDGHPMSCFYNVTENDDGYFFIQLVGGGRGRHVLLDENTLLCLDENNKVQDTFKRTTPDAYIQEWNRWRLANVEPTAEVKRPQAARTENLDANVEVGTKTKADAEIEVKAKAQRDELAKVKSAQEWSAKATKYYEANDWDEALKCFNEALKLNSHDSELYYRRGTIKQHKKDFSAAISDFDNAIALNAKNYESFENRARCQYAKGRFSEAVADVDKAIELQPDQAHLYSLRGGCKQELKDSRGAFVDYRKAAELAPEDAETQNGYAWMLLTCTDEALCNKEAALPIAKKAVQLSNQNDPAPMDTCALALFENGQTKEALAMVERAIELLPKDLPAEQRKEYDDHLERFKNAEKALSSQGVVRIGNPGNSDGGAITYDFRWRNFEGTWTNWESIKHPDHKYWLFWKPGGVLFDIKFSTPIGGEKHYSLEVNQVQVHEGQKPDEKDARVYHFEWQGKNNLDLLKGPHPLDSKDAAQPLREPERANSERLPPSVQAITTINENDLFGRWRRNDAAVTWNLKPGGNFTGSSGNKTGTGTWTFNKDTSTVEIVRDGTKLTMEIARTENGVVLRNIRQGNKVLPYSYSKVGEKVEGDK